MNNTMKILTTCFLVATLLKTTHAQINTTKEVETKPGALSANPFIVDDANFSLSIASKKEKFFGGEQVRVDIAFKNRGTSTATFFRPPVEHFYDIEVTDPQGRPAASLPSRFSPFSPLNRVVDCESRAYNFRPQEEMLGSIILSNIFDMSSPGKYKIKVSKKIRLPRQKELITINSDALVIEVASLAPISTWDN